MLRLLVSLIIVVLIQTLTAIGLLLQWAPHILRAAWAALSTFLSFSVVAYQTLLSPLAGSRLLSQPWRTVVCVLISTAGGLGIAVLAGWPVAPATLVILATHGLIVGLAWDDLGPPRGQSLGR